jgi:hypothetical protein
LELQIDVAGSPPVRWKLTRWELEVSLAAAGDEADEPGEDDGSDDGDEDGVEEATGAGVAEIDHEDAADEGADHADDDVDDGAEAGAAHDAAGEVAGDEADDDPDEEAVGAFGGLDVAIDVDVVGGVHRAPVSAGQVVRGVEAGEGCAGVRESRGFSNLQFGGRREAVRCLLCGLRGVGAFGVAAVPGLFKDGAGVVGVEVGEAAETTEGDDVPIPF